MRPFARARVAAALLALFAAPTGCLDEATSAGAQTGGAGAAGGSGTETKTGSSAPDFSTRDIDGNPFRLSDHLGKKVILIDFWATWCQPCMAEMPHLQRMYEAEKARGFIVVAVSMDGSDTLAEVPSFARRNQLTFPVVFDEDSRIASLYNPRKSAPLSVIIGRNGRIATIREGYNPGDEEQVYADVRKVLDQAPAAK
jgi:peroxiredoxin